MKGVHMFYLIAVSALFVALALPVATAGCGFAIVWGDVYDIGSGDGVYGADVEVLCHDNNNTATDTSGTNGAYSVWMDCPVGSDVTVTATKTGVGTGSNTGTIQDDGSITFGCVTVDIGTAEVDVGIPEFPFAFVPAILSLMSFAVVRRFV